MTRLSLKQINSTLVTILFCLGVIVAYGIYHLSEKTQQVEKNWTEFQAEYSEAVRLKGALDMAIGYGGMIHKFKNLILRKDLNEVDQVNAKLGAAYHILDQYSVLPLNQGEHAAIHDIRQTLNQYHSALAKIKEAIQQGDNAQTIDTLTKVNDSYALRGLQSLDQENIIQRQSILPGLSKTQQLNYLRTRLGYGGMIHNFKSYLLRHESQYLNATRQAITDSLAAINTYNNSGTNESEKLALNDITEMIRQYEQNLVKIKEALDNNLSIEATDKIIRFDDSLALRGLNILTAETNNQIQRQEIEMAQSLKQMLWLEKGLLLILFIVVAGTISLCIWLVNHHIGQPFSHMIKTMTSLAQGDTNVEITHVSSDNELGKMSQAICIFRDAMTRRLQSDIELKRANEELNIQLTKLEETRKHSEEQTNKALTLAENLAQARDESLIATQRAVSEKERAKAIIDTVSDGIITIDAQSRILSINPAAERLFGYSANELIKQDITVLMPTPLQERHSNFVMRFIENNKKNTSYHKSEMINRREITALRKDGNEIIIEVGIGISHIEGESIITGMIRDITQQKKLDKMKREFISTVSHELRTPLTAIKGSLGLLSSNLFSKKIEKNALEVIELTQRNTERLATLVNDLLDFEKLESGTMKINTKPLRAIDIIKNAIDENMHYGAENQISFAMDETVDAIVQADPGRIAQVMGNLLSNAAKFSSNGDTVNVGASRKNGQIHFYVNDHGPGVPVEFHDRIFERFTQADSSDIRSKGGTGLGMAISKAIIEKHHGTIGFDTEMGKGSSFYFQLAECESPVTVEEMPKETQRA